MAPVQGDVNGSQNCSCTSCFYKSESDHPSMRKMIAHGSKIDRLYYGKYVPLRERKLLDKLVRTRAVYDDVRKQLLSSSSISINKKADLHPRKKIAPIGKDLKDIEKSGAILELVDLVDKGAVLGPKKLSECCSCCFCSSNSLLPEPVKKRSRLRHVHGHRLEHQHGDARESSNASDVSGHGIGMESRRIKNVKIVAKQIQSDPCACSIKLSGMIRRRSKAMLKKLRVERPKPMYDSEWADTRQRRWHKRGAQIKKSLQGIKQTHEIENEITKFRLVESLAKVNRSKAKLRNNLETGAKKSLEKIKTAKINLKENLDSRIKESLAKINIKSDQLSNFEGKIFKIKKDSITQFREKLDKKRQLKKNRMQTARRHKHEKSSGDMTNLSDISVQARKKEATAKAGTKQQSLMSRKIGSTKGAPGQRLSVDITLKKGSVKQEVNTQIQKKVTKPKGVVIQENAFKKQEKRTKFKRGGSQELSIKVKENEFKHKRVEKQEINPQINHKVTKSKSVKSMINVQPKISNHSSSSITNAVEKSTKELKKAARKTGSPRSVKKVASKVSSASDETLEQVSDDNRSPRHAVKVSSSISFNNEFSKVKPKGNVERNIISLVKHKAGTRDKGQGHMRQTRNRNKYADARHKQLAKDTQAGLALKRCFCTLKLKAKRTKLKATKSKLIAANISNESVTKAIQTKNLPTSAIKIHKSQLSYELLPYECEPFFCIPGECNSIECERRIRDRSRKHHTSNTNTDYSTKSTPSLTSRSISSVTSRSIQASSPKEQKTEPLTSNIASKPEVNDSKSHKNAVRISSSFSFNIEFKKEDTLNTLEENNDIPHRPKVTKPPIKRTKNKGADHAKRHIRHKRSQISSSTGKSKYTITKHNLRRCFCTLKLAKTDKNQKKQLSKSTLTSNRKIKQIRSTQPEVMSRSIATDKETCRNKPICRILAHECEPGICDPDYCNPYDCLEIMKRNKNRLRRRNVQSSTDYKKIRSTSSLTSKSVRSSTAKKIQSSLVSYKSEVPIHYTKINTTAPSEVKTVPSNSKKQVVKIGSSFSFDIEFFKDKSSPTLNTPVKYVQESVRTQKNKKKEVKDRGFQGNVKRQHKSTLMDKNKRSVLIGPAMKRCFCTLKLHKTGKDKININTTNTGTETILKNKANLYVETVSKATKTNGKFKYKKQLDPYECEPNYCVPGECDPYECLKRIQKRGVESKEFGMTTNRSKMRTTSSITQKITGRSKKNYAQTKERKTKDVKKRKSQKAITSSEQSRKSVNIFPGSLSRQAVKIGSNFSFDIQFCKDRSSGKVVKDKIEAVKSIGKSIKQTNRGENPMKVPSIQRESQAEIIRKKHRAAGIGTVLKRCFCTLKLQNNPQKKRHSNRTFTHLKNPEVYAVSRIPVAGNEQIKPLISLRDEIGYRKITAKNNLYKSIPSIATEPNMLFRFKDMQSYFHETKESSFERQPFNQTVIKQTLQLKSKFTSNVKILKENNDFDFFNELENIKTVFKESQLSTERYWRTAINYFDLLKHQTSEIIDVNFKASDINGFSQYLKRRFCTMNIQVPGREKPYRQMTTTASTDQRPQANVKHKKYKLEPYECEPGVCIPNECDPFECQKRIMKRLARGSSKMSGTDIRSKSSSAYTNFPRPNIKGKKIQSLEPRPRRDPRETRQGIMYETVPTTRRQAVRVGSKFSFDIEFSKGRSQSSVKRINKSKYSNKKLKAMDASLKTRGTKGTHGNRQQRETQSRVIKMENRSSNMSPMLKRCFCTLKLQKKGRQHKERAEKVNQGTATPPNSRHDFVKSRYMNAGQNTRSPKTHKLLPYECEPNVCVPGQCNPYECLELIKKRNYKTKNFGAGSRHSMSKSSATISQKKKKKGKHVQSKSKHKPKIRTETDLPSKPVMRYATKPSRQAVRVGSCFSFNVQFYKDRNHGDQASNRQLKYVTEPRKIVDRDIKVREHATEQVGRRKKYIKERSSQDSKIFNNKDSQIERVPKHTKSSMTNSFMKRCFCTLKYFKPVKKSQKTASTETEVMMQQNKFGRDIAVQHGRRHRHYGLDPNECEPGICIPDACDPYVCAQIIKKRNANFDSKISGTERVRTRSVSSSFASSMPLKLKQTQSQPERAARQVKPKPSQNYSTSETYRRPISRNRQAVRIGSTFSFDIEFYKEKSPHYRQVQAAAKAIKGKPHRKQLKSREVKTKPKTNDKGVANEEISLFSRESQAQTVKQRNQGSGVGPLLKRCFCTLKLHKQKVQGNTEIPVSRVVQSVNTISVMTDENKPPIRKKHEKINLKPYECEPGVCIPGECDPYECDKLIQKRNRRDSSTTMRHHATKSTSSWAKTNSKKENRHIQNSSRQKPRQYNKTNTKMKQPKEYKDIKKKSNQAVKIGSNFSFNVEFFKDKSYGSGDIHPRLPKKRRETIRSTNSSSIKHRHQKSQREKRVRHMNSQVFAKKMRSKMTGVSPFLKRCFCTLKLHKPENKEPPVNRKTASTEVQQKLKLEVHPTIHTTNRGTHTKKTRVNRSPRNLDPYECEPGVCIPYECNPYECEKRIKKRLMRSQFSSTDKPKGRSVSILSSDSVRSQAKNTQATYQPRQRKNRKKRKDIKKYQSKEVRPLRAKAKKQAVKVGSCFSFNVEFFKDRSQTRNSAIEPDTSYHPSAIGKKNKMKEVATKLRTRNSSAFIEGISLRNRHSQAEGARTESRASGMGPLLKRCFCTLKLQKTGNRQKQHIGNDIPKFSPVIEARNVNVSTVTRRGIRSPKLYQTKFYPVIEARNVNVSIPNRNNRRSLQPYECEPNVCIPGECDPYECDKRIKRRMKELGTGTMSSPMKSVSCLTARRPKTAKNSKSIKTSISKETKSYRRKLKDKEPKRIIDRTDDKNCRGRQSVHLGSNFSFDMEFYKDRSQDRSGFNNKQPNTRLISPSIKIKESENTKKQIRKRSQRSSCKDQCFQNKNLQSEPVKTESRGSAMGSLLKRCFCTLKLQDKSGPSKIKCRDNRKPSKVSTQTKGTSTKIKKIPRDLDPYECEPLSCIPGECDPYECLKRIKNRDIKRQCRTIATHTRKCPQLSESSMISQLKPLGKSKKMQANIINKKNGISMIVEQPRFPINRLNRQAIKIGSNISFNIEFYKETVPFNEFDYSGAKKTNKDVKERKPASDWGSLKHKYVPSKLVKFNNTESQVEGVKTENKSSMVSNALKRCFCTAKLHKPCTPQCNWQKNPNVVTVNHAQRSPFYNPPVKCYFHYQYPKYNDTNQKCMEACAVHHTNLNDKKAIEKYEKKSSKKGLKLPNLNENNNTRNMETIFPYTPSKFKKSVSKTLLPLNKKEGINKSILKQNKKNILENDHVNDEAKVSKISKNRTLTAKKGKKSIQLKPIDVITSNPLRELMCRCKHIFTKQSKAIPSDETNISDLPKARRRHYGRGPQADPCICSRSLQTDKLKPSKSERTAKNLKTSSEPKKSKSLKAAKVSDKPECLDECRYLLQGKRKFSIFQSGDAKQTHLSKSKKILDKEVSKDSRKKNVQFLNVSSTKSMTNIVKKNGLKNKSNREYKKCHPCNEISKSNNFEEKLHKNPSGLPSFISKCICKLSNMTKGNSKAIEDVNQRESINTKKLQNTKSLAKCCKACPGFDKHKKKGKIKKENKIPFSSGDGLATTVPSTRFDKANSLCRNTCHPKKSLPKINISGSQIIIPSNMLQPKFRNIKGPVIKKSIKRTNIQKTQKKSIPVIKISDDIITYPESLFVPQKSTAFRFPKLCRASKLKMITGAKFTVKPKGKLPIQVCTCGNSTCAEMSMKRQLEDQEELSKSNLHIKPCICGSSTCAKETKKRFMNAEKKANNMKLPKPCICKSAVCAKKSMKRILDEKKKIRESKPVNPCICGSSLCAKEQKRLLELQKNKNKDQNEPCKCKFSPCAKERKRILEKQKDEAIRANAIPCICGSKVCSKEREKIIESKLKSKGKKKKLSQKQGKTPDNMTKDELKEYKRRLKQYKKEDDLRKKKRMRDHEFMYEQVNRFKNASGGLQVAESVRDIGKLAIDVASDILRGTFRAITDPRRTKTAVKTAVMNPKHATSHFKNAVLDTGVGSTHKRLRRRCGTIKTMQALKDRLEQNSVTNYLIHINEKDPKKRFNKKIKERRKAQHEPLDFGCSLYMGSLRRRPYLAVYYLCPWFYPHCISLMTLLRQFVDIMLFLLAVVVWSPCIVGMEICRAMMCCFFCTG